jgi:hypothetical protein
VSDEDSINFALLKRYATEGAVDESQPIPVNLPIEPAKDVSPREFPLSEQLGGNDALMESPPFGIVRSRRLVEGMAVAQKNSFRPIVRARYDLNAEWAHAGKMLPQNVLAPPFNR